MMATGLYWRYLLLAVLFCSSSAFLPTNAPLARYYAQPMIVSTTSTSSTELQMGFRNFIKKKVLRRKGDPEQPEQPADPADNDTISAGQRALEAMRTPPTADSPRVSTRDTSKIIQNAAATAASKQEPLRMGEDPTTGHIDVPSRLGPESVQERISRIKRGEMSPEEKEAFLKSALSTGNTPESRLPLKAGSKEEEAPKASPFPTDSILRNMARGNKPEASSSSSYSEPPPVMDSQSKKRKYLDMVTDPRRFNNLSSVTAGNACFDNEDLKSDASDEASSSSTVEEPNVPQDLGARLGAAAMVNEKRNAELRKQQLQAQQEQEQLQKERQLRLSKAHQEQQELLAKREVDIIRKRRAQELQQAQKQQKSNQIEEARRAELLKAQDDYWAKKMAADKAPVVDAKELMEEEEADKEEDVDEVVEEASDSTQDAAEEEETTPDVTGGRPPLNDIPTRATDHQTDQMRKKAEQQNEQMQRLRSLNSPLPNRAKEAAPRPKSKPAFEPQVPVNLNSRSQTPAQSLGDLTKTIKNSAVSAQTPTPAPAARNIPVPKPAPTPAPKVNNFFSRLGGGGGGGAKKPQTVASKPAPAPRPAPARAAAPRPAPARAAAPAPTPPKRKGPIRMEIPMGNDDEAEEPAMTEGMTIGEIMKRQKANGGGADQDKRSKQWGVDMSRFQE